MKTKEKRQVEVFVFGASFVGANLAVLLLARNQAGKSARVLGAALPLAVLPCAASGWRLGEHARAEFVGVAVLAGIGLGLALFKRSARLASPFEPITMRRYFPLGISLASFGLGLGNAAYRYVENGL